MNEIASRLDDAQARLKSTTERPYMTDQGADSKRAKDPSYVVFAQGGEDGVWDLLTPTPVKASSRKAAIVAAAPGEGGTFFAIPAEQFKPPTRTVRQTTVDDGDHALQVLELIGTVTLPPMSPCLAYRNRPSLHSARGK